MWQQQHHQDLFVPSLHLSIGTLQEQVLSQISLSRHLQPERKQNRMLVVSGC